MDLKTFLGAIIRLVISHIAIYPPGGQSRSLLATSPEQQTSKSICGNLNSRLKNGGSRSVDLESGRAPFRDIEMCGVKDREGGGEVRDAYMLQLSVILRVPLKEVFD